MRPFAERLRSERILQGLTREELAKRSGVSKRSIDQYEIDTVVPTIYMASYLAEALDASLDYLCGLREWRH